MADARKPRRRSRRDLDAVADGAPDETPLGAFVSEMRAMGARDGVEPNQTLTEFVSAPSREPDLVVASTTPPKARTPMIAQLSALAATTVGKVALTGGIAAAAVGGAVVVNEIQDPDPVEVVATADDSTSTTTPAPTATPDDDGGESAPAGSSTHAVLDAGSVTVAVDGLSVSVVSADPNPGWTAEIETDEPGEAQVNFRNGDARIDFRAEIEDGQLRIRIRDRRTDTETETFPNSDNPAATPTPDDDDDDDHDDDDDRSGSNSGSDSDDDDEDRSGSNSDSDSDDDDEDRSGSNSDSDSDDDDEDRSGSNSDSDSDDDDEDRSGSNSDSDDDDDDEDRSGSNSGSG